MKKFTNYKRRGIDKAIIYEHRLIAESLLGRPLLSTERVHHIDEDRYNNDPDNLLVFASNADHARFHKLGKDAVLVEQQDGSFICLPRPAKRCSECDTLIDVAAQRCVPCHNRYQERVNWPSTEDLIEEVTRSSFEAVGRRLGVSGNAVRKRINRHS